jgi:hypothetical protein
MAAPVLKVDCKMEESSTGCIPDRSFRLPFWSLNGLYQTFCSVSVVALSILISLSSGSSAFGALPPEVRKEVLEMQKELRSVSGLIRNDDLGAASAIIEKVQNRLKELNLSDTEPDRAVITLRELLQKSAAMIPVDFTQEILPVLQEHCVRCHSGDQPAGRLQLDSYQAMTRGGQSGRLLIPGVPERSLLAAVLTTADPTKRMPREGDAVPSEKIALVVRWIRQGAPADADGEKTAKSRSKKSGAKSAASKKSKKPDGDEPEESVKPGNSVSMADGTETVSFTRDIAPIFVNLCLGCHSGNMPRGGYNVTTFEQVLKPGKTGSTIVPGNPDDSYLIDLVLRQQPMKMPQGQAQLKRSQAVAMETWVREGARFDGSNPKAPIRSLVPTAAEIEAAKLAAMSEEEMQQKRTEQAEAFWKRVAPRETASSVRTVNFLLHGNVSQERLEEFGRISEEHLSHLQERFSADQQSGSKKSQKKKRQTQKSADSVDSTPDPVPSDASMKTNADSSDSENMALTKKDEEPDGALSESEPSKVPSKESTSPWRGGLIVFVSRERFEYEEFNTVLMDGRRTPESVSSHVVITPGQETAYLVIQDTGDTETERHFPAATALRSALAQAWLTRTGTAVPDWLSAGFGLSEAEIPSDSALLKSMTTKARSDLSTIESPEKIFESGILGPDEAPGIGLMAIKFLHTRGGQARLKQLVNELQESPDLNSAFQKVWNVNSEQLGRAFLQAASRGTPRR